MSDDPPSTRVSPDWSIPNETRERLLPTFDELRTLKDKEVADRINGLIESVETGRTSTQGGADKVAVIAKAQYLTQELARRSQNRQTWAIIAMTAVITAMTAVIMAATIWPDWAQSHAQSLPIRASQVIDRLRAS
jgi:hypothetical protein